MNEKIDIYKDFMGYNSYPLMVAERIIRERILKEFTKQIEKLKECEEKVRKMRLLKILEHIVKLKHRLNRMENQIKERDELYIPAYLKERITSVDEEKLRNIDTRVVELITKNNEILESLSCAETDTHIINKFTRINEYLREIDSYCHARTLILKKEIL